MGKRKLINEIKKVVEDYQSLSVTDIKVDSPIVISTPNIDTQVRVEVLNLDDVLAVTYIHDREEDRRNIPYAKLSDEVLNEINESLRFYIASNLTYEQFANYMNED